MILWKGQDLFQNMLKRIHLIHSIQNSVVCFLIGSLFF